MRMTLEQIQLALNGGGFIDKNFTNEPFQIKNRGFDILHYSYSMIITEEEFYRVFTWNAQNELWECWGIEYSEIELHCDIENQNFEQLNIYFHKEEKYLANCKEQNNPYYEHEMKRLGMID